MAGFGGFRPAAFRFLRDLERNNEKAWFEANRDVYEREVREPMRLLVETLDARLGSIAPEIVGDPKRSMFRIHRDVRFSKNKSPYKTNAGAWLYHRDAGRKVGTVGEGGGAGFYFHIDPTTCFMAGGMWMPARPALLRIREAIAAQPTALARLTSAPGFRRRFDGLSEEAKLRRVPREFPPDHPAAEWLKLQSFTARALIERSVVTSPRLVDRLCRDFELLVPLVRWLNRALGYQPANDENRARAHVTRGSSDAPPRELGLVALSGAVRGLPAAALVKARPAGFQVGVDVDQDGLAFLVQVLGPRQRGGDLRRLLDGDADRAQAFGDLGVVAGHVGHVELLARHRIAARVGGHVAVVQEHGGDGRAGADGGFDVQTGHAEGAIAHEVQAELVGLGELGADHQGDAVAQVRRLAPADVAVGDGGGEERHDGVARRARVVRDDAVSLCRAWRSSSPMTR